MTPSSFSLYVSQQCCPNLKPCKVFDREAEGSFCSVTRTLIVSCCPPASGNVPFDAIKVLQTRLMRYGTLGAHVRRRFLCMSCLCRVRIHLKQSDLVLKSLRSEGEAQFTFSSVTHSGSTSVGLELIGAACTDVTI